MRRRTVLLLALLGSACGGGTATAPPGNGPGPDPAPRTLVLLPLHGEAPSPAGGGGPVARVEVAADPLRRSRGLMGRTSLPADTGMLFVYAEPGPRSFWMKGCPIPLSAAFLDGGGRILNIVEMAPGEGIPDRRLPYYESAGDARFVVEMAAGWFEARGLRPGDRVDLDAALAGVVPR